MFTDKGTRHHYRVPCPQLLRLRYGAALLWQHRFQVLRTLPCHHTDFFDARLQAPIGDPVDHRLKQHLAQCLRIFRFHSGALSGSQDDRTGFYHHDSPVPSIKEGMAAAIIKLLPVLLYYYKFSGAKIQAFLPISFRYEPRFCQLKRLVSIFVSFSITFLYILSSFWFFK